MKCPFCLADGKLSKEHLFSRPICDAFGIDRSTLVASVDGMSGDVNRIGRLHERSVRLPCETCNSGWMSRLEQDTSRTLKRWMSHPDETLTRSGLGYVTRWLAKTAIVLAFGEVDARRFLSTPTETAVPDITTARAVAEESSLDHVYVGAARTDNPGFLWGTGNSTVLPTGPDRISSRAINVAAITLHFLQLWIVMPIIRPDQIRLPKGVIRLHGELRSGELRTRDGNLDPTQVRATYSDETTMNFFQGLALAQERAGA